MTIDKQIEMALKALASDKRLQVLDWLKDPVGNFPPQVDGDLITDGVCANFITDKLGVSQPTAARHLKVLADAGLIIPTRKKGWTFYRRDEAAISRLKRTISEDL
ncbi:ArsR/SmtB family transcription factor [Kordiimonas marina]|uniref:ArsR/SmtB family transcription factor n=1 Tax=Kordiimonas marina TaxID=2872312 RepID=UPI001FF5EE40|nr:helix-turn-helix transcriptional regulator [Kordiimonas marina]MCJ9427494.1 ArsR family transcriptional regulator [Kordiimonas marina]